MRNRKIERALQTIQQGHYFLPYEKSRFRISQLPFCPLLFVIDSLENSERKISFESGFYFHIGHAIHTLWQTVARYQLPDQVIGDWQCTRTLNTKQTDYTNTVQQCNRVVHFCSFNQAAKYTCPHRFKNCQEFIKYKELELIRKNLTGHTDLLLRDQQGYHLIDFKTTSGFLFEAYKKALSYGYYPNPRYKLQLENYIILLEKKYKIKIVDYTVAYVSRDKALEVGRDKHPALRLFTYKTTNRIRRQARRNLQRYQRMFNIANNWLNAKHRNELTKKLFTARPCHNHKQYHERMAAGFLSNAPCPHHTSGACYGDGKAMRKILRKLESVT